MPDYAADGTMSPQAAEPGSHEQGSVGGEAREPLVRCPSCGAEVVPREASYGANEPSRGLACTNCGAIIDPAR